MKAGKKTASDYWLGGIHAVTHLLEQSPQQILEIWLDQTRKDKRIRELEALLQQAGLKIQYFPAGQLDHKLPDLHHQGVIVRIKPRQALTEKALDDLLDSLDEAVFLLALDGITDPHNLGAILRTADAAGVHAVIAPKDRSASLNATVGKVASGAAETVAFVQVTNLVRTLEKLKQRGIWVTGTAGESQQNLFETDLAGNLAIVMGSEGKGLRRLTRETCDNLVKLPMQGQVESLNVSVATGICLFEAVRQRCHD